MITLTGLTPRQRQWAEILWLTSDGQEVAEFCRLDQDARVVRDLIVAAELDQVMEVTTYVKDLIQTISSR